MKLPTILYVENDPVALTMYQKRLEREGFHVETATDGIQALEHIIQRRPDVLMLDLMLPALSGADVLRFVLSTPELKDLPTVIFSNAPATEIPAEVTLNGSVKFLSKIDCPFPTLLETLREVLAGLHSGSDTGLKTPATAPESVEAAQDVPLPKVPSLPLASARQRERVAAESEASFGLEPGKLRQHCFAFIKAPAAPAGAEHLASLRQNLQALHQHAEQVNHLPLVRLTAAFGALLDDIAARPSVATPAALQTIAQAMDCLDRLTQDGAGKSAQPFAKPQVLAVDDDPVCTQVMTRVLKRASFEGDCVLSPQAALELATAKPYDILLLDIDMPGMNGFELCEKLRRMPQYKATPVVFITAHNNFENRKQSVLSGAHDFVAKPVAPFDLALKITVLLIKHRAQQPEPAPVTEASPARLALVAPTTPLSAEERETPPTPRFDASALVSPVVAALQSLEPAASGERAVQTTEGAPAENGSPLVPPAPQEPVETASALLLEPRSAGVEASLPVTESMLAPSAPEPPAPVGPLGSDGQPAPAFLETTKEIEQPMQKGQNPAFDKIVTEVARILFGDENVNDINMRLVRMALEGAKVHELVKSPAGS